MWNIRHVTLHMQSMILHIKAKNNERKSYHKRKTYQKRKTHQKSIAHKWDIPQIRIRIFVIGFQEASGSRYPYWRPPLNSGTILLWCTVVPQRGPHDAERRQVLHIAVGVTVMVTVTKTVTYTLDNSDGFAEEKSAPIPTRSNRSLHS